MIDLVKLKLTGGDGGAGKVSLHREKYVPKGGPDGGAGGNGGSIKLVGDPNLNTLKHYAGAKVMEAEDGQPGGKNNKHGKQGQDLLLKVPLGTVVWLLAENEVSRIRRKKHEAPHVDFDLEVEETASPEKTASPEETASLDEKVKSESKKSSEDQEEQEAGEQVSKPNQSPEINPFRLHITRGRDEVDFEKYYLEEEGQRIPYQQQKNLMPADPSREQVPVKEFSPDEISVDEIGVDLEAAPAEEQGELEEQEEREEQASQEQAPQKQAIKLVEIREPGQEVIVCQGGFGGRGNSSFKSSVNRTPLEAEYGTPGEKKLVVFELRLLADVGLVGFPNAGKSTLLSRLTKAHPKIANYPFTTLEPQLGVMSSDKGDKELIIADIPGLIEGASQGKGLGDKFLRHIHNCRELMYVLYLEEGVVFNEELALDEKAQAVWEQYQQLKEELEDHHPELLDKKYVIGLNKIDIYDDDLIEAVVDLFEREGEEILPFSGITGDGLNAIKQKLLTQ